MVFRLGVNNWGFKEIENKKPSKNSIAGEIKVILNEIKEQTRKLAAGCSKHRFEVVDRTDEVSSKPATDEVSSKHRFEVVGRTTKQ
ncbi:chlorohydrolase [Streptococcus pneumoniae]|nr:chlorohydrolase [Streptococcus pneumoniae]